MFFKIAFGGLKHESNGFANFNTELEDFKIMRGRDSIPLFLRKTFPNICFIPTLYARALPGGIVSRKAYEELRNELLFRLENSLPIDGIYLDLHGAMRIVGIDSGEVDLLNRIRDIVGWDIPIALSLDLHGNISPKLLELVDIITAYRTAPHIDWEETCLRAMMTLIRVLRKNIKPIRSIVKIPFILPGEWAVTYTEPAKTLYNKLVEYESNPYIIDTSLLIGCMWSDSPFSNMSIIFIGREREDIVSKLAEKYGEEVWSRRKEFGFEVDALSIEDSLDKAIKLPGKPIFISDSGDNITAGAAGDTNICLSKAIERRCKNVLIAGIFDRDAVEKCFEKGTGSSIRLEVGGKIDNVNCKPIQINGRIINLKISSDGTKLTLLRINGIDVILTSRRKTFHMLRDFYEIGVDPRDYKIVVVKIGYLVPSLRILAYKNILALTPGFTDQVIERLKFKNIKRPVYPLDEDFSWTPKAITYK